MAHWHSLPDLPPRLKSAVLAAADNLAAIAHFEGIELGDHQGEATPHLITLLYNLARKTQVPFDKLSRSLRMRLQAWDKRAFLPL